MKIIKSSSEKIKSLRNEYLKKLPEFQELYIELMVPTSNKYLLTETDDKIGYVIVTEDGVLIEYYLAGNHYRKCSDYFDQIINSLSVKSILCKSFDSFLLNCCLIKTFPYELIGVLYRDYYNPGIKTDNTIEVNLVDESTVEIIMQYQDCFDELFETEDYLRSFIKNEKVFLFYKGNELVGCGTLIKTHPDWEFCDLGVWVNSNYRKQGMGIQIIHYLRERAINLKLKPSCGCAIDNIASQKTIEKSGFISRHKLIEFKVIN